MSQAMQPFRPDTALPAAIAQIVSQQGGQLANPLAEGVGSSFANLSFKGKIFRIKYAGEEVVLQDPNTGFALQFIDVVVVDAKGTLSKTYYATGYTEGVTEQPDCSSEDGITPTAPVGKQVQCHDCRMCKWNVFGSKPQQQGQPASNSKACADTRKTAIVPIYNIANERFGGPMLLRVPAASLSGLAQFSRTLAGQGAPFYAAVVRITFDNEAAFPKLVFTPLRFLNEQEAAQILELRQDIRVADILSSGAMTSTAALPPPMAGQVPSSMQGAPTQTPVAAQASAPPVTTAAPPAQQYAPPVQQYAPPAEPVYAPQQPVQPAPGGVAFGVPTPPPPAPQAYAAPQIPVTAPVQQAPQPPPVYAPPVAPPAAPQYAPPQAPPVQQQYAPPVQQYAPPAAPPTGTGFAPPADSTQQYAPPQAPPIAPAQQGPVSQQVLNSIDAMLG